MKEQCRTAEWFLPDVLTAPTNIIIRLVTRVTARPLVDTPLSVLFLQNYSQNTEKNCITVLSSTPVYLSCCNYFSRTKLPEGGLLNEHV